MQEETKQPEEIKAENALNQTIQTEEFQKEKDEKFEGLISGKPNPLEELLNRFEDSTEEAKDAIIQQIEDDKKKLILNKYVESLKGMSRRHIIRVMKRKAKELGLNEIQ